MNTSDSNLDSTHLLRFIFDRRRTFALIGAAAFVLSSIAALMMEEQFKSTVIMFATPQHSIGEQFYEEIKRNDLLEYDYETSTKRQIKSNIYLAKVTRVEPSLQAAFVEYGGNRHGFLAFSEIHPDYFQIPVSDREKLAAEQARLVEEALYELHERNLR